MTDTHARPGPLGALAAADVVSPESLGRVLLRIAALAVRGRDCAALGRAPLSGRHRGVADAAARRQVLQEAGRQAAVPGRLVSRVDAGAVARWMVQHYSDERYPAVIIGSPHGAAVHLAAALGAAWLPAEFTTQVSWPGGVVDDPCAALVHGAPAAARLLAGNPDVTVRQTHDPVTQGVLAAAAVTLHVRWRSLPEAYRSFIAERLAPGAPVLVLRDARIWPVLDVGGGHTFQLGSPVGGWQPHDYDPVSPALRACLRSLGGGTATWRPPGLRSSARYAERGVEPDLERSLAGFVRDRAHPLHRVLYPSPDSLSAVVADIHRAWLRDNGGAADGCVIGADNLLDPSRTVASGLVPYWCESAAPRTVAAAECWIAGSEPFASVDVLPAPPGTADAGQAGLAQWGAVASFGRRHGRVNESVAGRYPLHPVPSRAATEALGAHPLLRPAPRPLDAAAALAGLRANGVHHGMLIC